MPNWKKLIVSGSDASLNNLFVTNAVTASYGKFTAGLNVTGSLLVTQSYISTLDYIDFTETVNPSFLTGRVHWIDDTKTLNIDTDVNNFSIEVGHQNVLRAKNSYGFTLTKGTIVYINGESGQRPTIATASWETDSRSASTIGFVAQNITSGQNGYVITNGILRGINTNAYAPGTMLYLSSSGQYTSTVPVSPLHEVRLGKTITQATDGTIYVDIMNGYEIGELHDVSEINKKHGDLLIWNSGSRVYRNSKILSGSYGISGSLNVSHGITGSLFGTASYATKSASVTTLNQTVQINGVLIISSSLFQYGSNIDVDTGTETVITLATGSYRSAFFDYVVTKTTNTRAGTVMAVWNGSTIQFTETSTNDIGTTSDLTLRPSLSGANVLLRATALSNDWSVKTLARLI